MAASVSQTSSVFCSLTAGSTHSISSASSRQTVRLAGTTWRTAAVRLSNTFPRTVSELSADVVRNVDPSKVVPQGERILIKLQELEQATPGGVLLPKQAVKYDRHLVGEVVAVGKEVSNIAVGQKVMVSDLNAYEVRLGSSDDKLSFCRASDILAIVEN
eukprot:TRINITY_DN219_c0_g1_i1.p1 TRINITY_DN219_c0_g1~~TRINITY_DN219_c0_g1_i1.p1  ORF type:complete len:159 (+),score=40.97 TRINITY_DN219_c0_g1_i1:150-626(+)